MFKNTLKKSWPKECIWPEPGTSYYQYDDGDEYFDFKKEIRICPELADIIDAREYFNHENFDDLDDDEDEIFPMDLPEEYWPYWDNGFDYDFWVQDFEDILSSIKLYGCDAVYEIEALIEYEFADENLIRQSFTRPSFANEYGLDASSEVLEFFGDKVLDYIMIRNMAMQYARLDTDNMFSPLISKYDEGDMTKIKNKFVCKEYLAGRTATLGLDKYILYGSNDTANISALEDTIEALIGAVAIDSDWNFETLDNVVDRLLNVHLESPDEYLKKDGFELLNSWHQKHFGTVPEYRIFPYNDDYQCDVYFNIPTDDGIQHHKEYAAAKSNTRSSARSKAAMNAIEKIKSVGKWINLNDAKIIPNEAIAINQLQELHQKGYIGTPEYQFIDLEDCWQCDCSIDAVKGFGRGKDKTSAKKNAAYMALVRLFQSAGLCSNEYENSILDSIV